MVDQTNHQSAAIVLETDGKTPVMATERAAEWLFACAAKHITTSTAKSSPLWQEVLRSVRDCIKAGKDHAKDTYIETATGEKRHLCISVVFSQNGMLVHLEDMGGYEGHKRQLSIAKQRFNDMAQSFADWLWETDGRMIVTYVSGGRSRSGVNVQDGDTFIKCFMPEASSKVKNDIEKRLTTAEPFYDYEYWGVDSKGIKVCWSISGVPVFDDNDKHAGFRGVARDITAEKSSEDQLYFMANNDYLTGLYNRGRFYDEMMRAIRDMRRHNKQGSLSLIDIDRFKYVNDTFGHEAGDELLVYVADIIRKQVGQDGIIARLGGDEFAIIQTDIKPVDVLQKVQNLLEAFNNTSFRIKGQDINLSASVGISLFPEQGTSSGELLSKADMAMYKAKQEGRNRFHIFDDQHSQDNSMAKRLETVDFIVRALEEGRLVMHYQPIVPLQEDASIKHYETLCRMVDEGGKIIPPLEFIETAEDFGLIARIDTYVVSKTLAFLKAERDKGRDLHLSMNLSGLTFEDEEAIRTIKDLLAEYKLPEGVVIFEITETAALRDLTRAQEIIHEIKAYGAKFALDDFGVGYSSFSYIKHLDIDYLKIDGSFVRNLNENADDKLFVKALADVARGMNIKTIAEMVENDELVKHLIEIGIDYGQGYHFGRPQPELLPETSPKGANKSARKGQ